MMMDLSVYLFFFFFYCIIEIGEARKTVATEHTHPKTLKSSREPRRDFTVWLGLSGLFGGVVGGADSG